MEITEKNLRNQLEIVVKSIAFDTKSNGNCRKPIRNHQEIVMKSIAFDTKSIEVDTKSSKIIQNPYEINRKSL